MTIDERLERLTERQEALMQAVERLASMQRDNEARLETVAGILGSSAETGRGANECILRLSDIVARVVENQGHFIANLDALTNHVTRLTNATHQLVRTVASQNGRPVSDPDDRRKPN